MSARPRLLVLRALGLGDFLTGVPAMRALGRRFPYYHKMLAAPGQIRPLAALSGAVDEVVDAGPLTELPPKASGCDVAVNLHGRGPQSHRILLATRPRRLVAFANAEITQTGGMPRWRPGEHEVARWCRMLAESGIPADPSDLRLPRPDLPVPDHATAALLIHPGAGSGARRWPAERWAAVAEARSRAGHRVVLTGTRAERPLVERIARLAALPEEAVMAGRTDLAGLAALVAAARAVACADTGVAHLATALGTPSVVLFGPVPPEEWGPPIDRRIHRALWAGGRGDPHAAEPDPGILAIQIDSVLEALHEVAAEDAMAGTGAGP